MLGFWVYHSMCVFGVLIVDTDAASYEGRHPHRILYHHKRRKKGNYIEAFTERQCHFTPLVFAVDGVMGKETKAATEKLADYLLNKWEREYP